MTVWWTLGFNAIIYLAGLQDISTDLYEAAEVEVAGTWQKFRSVTLVFYTVLVLLALIFTLPLLWMVSTSFKTADDATSVPAVVDPTPGHDPQGLAECEADAGRSGTSAACWNAGTPAPLSR